MSHSRTVAAVVLGWFVSLAPMATGNEGPQAPSQEEATTSVGYPIPGVSFQVFLGQGKEGEETIAPTLASDVIDTVVQAFDSMVQHRTQYKRFDQALTKDMLQKVVIEPRVLNRDGKEFPFLVARTKQKGKVKLLINALRLKQDGYLDHPERLAPRLAKEFQWVVSKASTNPKREKALGKRDLQHAPIKTNAEINAMSSEERERTLQELLTTYMKTVDSYASLMNQPYYEIGTTTLTEPAQPDSAIKLYDIRIREALHLIVTDPYFWENTPKAVRSLLNGKIWHVTFVKIDDRDWTTRTRVVPKDKAVVVGKKRLTIQPAKILVNYHRSADPNDPLFAETRGLPMGALSAERLARVIAWEIQTQITEKSMRGHVAEDEKSEPK